MSKLPFCLRSPWFQLQMTIELLGESLLALQSLTLYKDTHDRSPCILMNTSQIPLSLLFSPLMVSLASFDLPRAGLQGQHCCLFYSPELSGEKKSPCGNVQVFFFFLRSVCLPVCCETEEKKWNCFAVPLWELPPVAQLTLTEESLTSCCLFITTSVKMGGPSIISPVSEVGLIVITTILKLQLCKQHILRYCTSAN